MGEFELIRTFFARPFDALARDEVALGMGDDCALLATPPHMQLAISTDMLVEGRHFLSTVSPRSLGHKALAVNLSDLAACGAKPVAFSLALSLPQADPDWLYAFSEGLFALALQHRCALIGGDTTRGPLNLCITVYGHVPKGEALLRTGARVGDDLYVSGGCTSNPAKGAQPTATLGEARMALEVFRGNLSLPSSVFEQVRARMECPTPRVALGIALRGLATSCLDVSDGLLGDLGHILRGSEVGARLETAWLDALEPPSALGHLPKGRARVDMAYAGGDDYELLFTVPPSKGQAVQAAAAACDCAVTRIGSITAPEGGCVVLNAKGDAPLPMDIQGFDHFLSKV